MKHKIKKPLLISLLISFFMLSFVMILCLKPVAIPLTKERKFHENTPFPSNSESWYYITKTLGTEKLATDLNDDIIVVGLDHFTNWYDSIILLKLNSSGFLLFEKNLTLNLHIHEIGAISVDSNNCIYVSGKFSSVSSKWDLFLIKFDVLGNMHWIRTWGGDDNEYVQGISVDTNDNIYISGNTRSYSDVLNIFLVKYDNTGNFEWAQIWGSNTTDSICYALATDSNDNNYIAGRFESKGCLIKYNSSGFLQWNITLDYDSLLRDLAIDLQNNIYIISRRNYSKLSILKYNDDGICLWNKSYTINDYFSSSIAMDSSGSIYIGGKILLHYASGSDAYDMFIMKCNNSGSFQWFIQFGTCFYENFKGITCDSLGNVYILSDSHDYSRNEWFIVLFKNPPNGLKLFQSINGYGMLLFCSVIIISMTSIMLLIVKFKKSLEVHV